jgi:hypothetical protein
MKEFTQHELSKIFGAYIPIMILCHPNGEKILHRVETNRHFIQNHQQLMNVILLKFPAWSLHMGNAHFAGHYHTKKIQSKDGAAIFPFAPIHALRPYLLPSEKHK